MTQPGDTSSRRGAPWSAVVGLGVVAVVLAVGLVLSLTRDEAAAPTTDVPRRDGTAVELPTSAGGYQIPADDPTGLDREATRRQITDASGAGADVATYVGSDGPAFTATAVRLDALPLFSVQRPPEEAADVITRVEQVGDVRCQTGGQGDALLVLQCQRSTPGLTVSVVPTDPGATGVEEASAFVQALFGALD
ncbi:hypothetical protein [Solicola sp. PLA-1-18]|uniref:hypothetical protein n=1 Tax=Solicola sp. PLA-1-18 TaxID=3380532 RepID=UPI003B7AE2FF